MNPQPAKRVLVVDDMAIFREPIQLALRAAGYDVATAADGVQAIAAISNRRPDVILLDINMPGMNGVSLLRRLRATPSLASIPVLVLSANADAAQIKAAMHLGVSGYLQKSQFSFRSMIARIERLAGEPSAAMDATDAA
ncbi:MAG TPA: response regulator [Phycisphaerales bacterium]|nr:response regulator [Phycisphaerales bacterium]